MTGSHPPLIQRFVRDRAHFLGFLHVLCRDPDLAEDLFQELSVVVLENLDRYDRSREFGPWVRGIARNLCYKAMARRSREAAPIRPEFLEAMTTAYDERTLEEEEAAQLKSRRLHDCMAKLHERQRQVLVDKYEKGLKSREIAAKRGSTVASIESLLMRVRSALLKCMAHGIGERA
jgi:RNA polymerase sigma-70 factor (ECF subfamily)